MKSSREPEESFLNSLDFLHCYILGDEPKAKALQRRASHNGCTYDTQNVRPSGSLNFKTGCMDHNKNVSPVKVRSPGCDSDVRKSLGGTDEVQQQGYSDDLLDILLSREAVSSMLCSTSGGGSMNRSDSLTRRKRRPRTAEHDGSSSVDRERSRQPSPVSRCPPEVPPQDFRQVLGRRVSLPVTSSGFPLESAVDLLGRQTSCRKASHPYVSRMIILYSEKVAFKHLAVASLTNAVGTNINTIF